MKKRSEETQTLRAGCSKVEPNIFAPPQTPLPGARDGQNLISWRWSLLLPTNPVWWGSMHAISSYRGNRPTPTETPHRQDRLQYTAPQLASTQCNQACRLKVVFFNMTLLEWLTFRRLSTKCKLILSLAKLSLSKPNHWSLFIKVYLACYPVLIWKSVKAQNVLFCLKKQQYFKHVILLTVSSWQQNLSCCTSQPFNRCRRWQCCIKFD